MRILPRRAAGLATTAACILVTATSATARPLAVEDLLRQESLGAAAFDPTGRWLVFEQRDRYDTAPSYDLYNAQALALTRLKIVDAHASAPAPRDLAEAGRGLTAAGFSPRGTRLAVYRLSGRRWMLGVITLATGAIRWLDVTPEEVRRGRVLQWLSEDAFLLLERPDQRTPSSLAAGFLLSDRLPALWAAAADGRGAHTAFGSGRYLDIRERGPGNRLIRVDAGTGATTLLAEGRFIDLELSPGKDRVALFESGADLQPRGDSPVRGLAGTETEATRLSILDLRSGRMTAPCPDFDILPNLLSWSPSGRSLLLYTRAAHGPWSAGRLRLLQNGRLETVGADLTPQLDTNPVSIWTDWLGEAPVVLGRRRGAPRDDWHVVGPRASLNLTGGLPEAPDRRLRVAGGSSLMVLAGDSLWRVGAGRPAERLAAGASALPFAAFKRAEGGRLVRAPTSAAWVRLGDGAVARLSGDGLSRTHLTLDGESPELAPSGAAALRRRTDAQGRTALDLVRPGGIAPLALVNADWGEVDPLVAEPIRHLGPDGQPLVSWLFLPPRGTGPAPLVVRPYLGDNYPAPPEDRDLQAGFLQNLRVLTGRGYAVLAPSLPNPGGIMSDPGTGLAGRLDDIVDLAANDARFAGRVDFDRAALMGWSFGGYTVMKTLTQTRRYRAAVSVAGVSDFLIHWGQPGVESFVAPEQGYLGNWITGGVERTQPSMLGPPWAERDRYLRNSALLEADKIETPLLMLHGAFDLIDSAQSAAMYTALFRQAKDAQLVMYWGMIHTANAPGDVRDIYRRVFDFLDEHLGPVSAAHAPAHPRSGSASGEPKPPPRPPT
ncbi:prolyl oligopeptidase family serine peptidase [Phenylobacterium sp. VNQ135]|uniref:S9 family peptidase n=1 Tax=Phenylobacterium sp. VNQ135 TaxID=3400922 RepID=UPI003C076742